MSFDNTGPNLSDVDRTLLIEQYGGVVESQFAKASIMRQYAQIRPVRGTDTITNNRVGKTTLKALVPGVRPPADPTPFGKVSVTVDTIVIARDNRSTLNDFQTHFDARSELGKDHGKQIGKFFDQAFIIMAIKGAQMAAPDFGMGAEKNSIGAGKSVQLLAGEEADPDILAQAIEDILVAMEEEEVPTEEALVMVRPTEYKTLLNNNKLTNSLFSPGNGDYAQMKITLIADSRIVKSARIPREISDGHHFLSNAQNGYAYDVAAKDAKAVAVILHPKAFLAGETIPLTSNVFYDDVEKQWFIDSWLAFGVAVNRPDVCGAVFKA